MKNIQDIFNQAFSQHQKGELNDAESAYLKILESDSELKPRVLYLISNLYYHVNSIAKAIKYCEQLLYLQPKNMDANKLYGQLLIENGLYQQALDIFKDLKNTLIDDNDVIKGLARSYLELGNLEAASEQYTLLLPQEPDSWQTYYNLGLVKQKQELLSQAEMLYHSALGLNHETCEAFNNLGEVQQDQGKLEEAEQNYQKGLKLKPDSVELLNNLGTLFHECGRYDKAITCYEAAISIQPDYPDAHLNLSLSCLLTGQYQRGWDEYEWRWKISDVHQYKLDIPLWEGHDLKGKIILVYSEQGFGDTFQFLRYIPLLNECGASIIFHTRAPLKTISEWCEGLDEIHVVIDEYTDIDADFMCPLMSLPKYFNTDLDSIPADIPYLKPVDADVKKCILRIPEDKLKVGIVWGGQPKFKHDNYRNPACPLSCFEPLVAMEKLAFVSLQKGDARDQLDNVSFKEKIYDLDEQINDFVDTANFITELDLIVTIDTSVAHLAGAMGKTVWLLLPVAPDWRWMLDRDDSPWYPGMRIFRQQKPGDWNNVMQQVCTAMEAILSNRADVNYSGELDQLMVQGAELIVQGQNARAEKIYRRCLDLMPGHFDALNNLAIALKNQCRLDEAVLYLNQAIDDKPMVAAAYNNLGNIRKLQHKLLDAKICYEKALSLNPDDYEVMNNLGNTLQALNNTQEAIVYFKRAIAINPDFAQAHFNYAIACLLAGNYEVGWQEYEWGFATGQRSVSGANLTRWTGQDLNGKNLLVIAEQGVGDTIQFLRFMPILKKQGAIITLQCDSTLTRLLNNYFFLDKVVDTIDFDMVNADYYVSMMSIPYILKISLETLPDTIPYLMTEITSLRRWKKKLENTVGYKAGIVWAGNPVHENDANRSCSLENFLDILKMDEVHFYSLQKGAASQQIDVLSDGEIEDLNEGLNDYADTAAAISCMDFVITVDTSVAHLAGALGKPVFLLLPFAPDWRWLLDREDSPWYPGMKLFRQEKPGDWPGVLRQVKCEIEKILRPASHNDLMTLAQAAIEKGLFSDAISLYENLLAIEDNEIACNNLGKIYLMRNDLDTARTYYMQAININPDNVTGYNGLAAIFLQEGRINASMRNLNKVIQLQDDHILAHYNKGLLYLLQGDYDRGWCEYEYRLALPGRSIDTKLPRWKGEPSPDMTIRVIAEQGIGDTLQFVRFLSELRTRCQYIILECQQGLKKLLGNLTGVDEIVESPAQGTSADAYIPLMSLAGLLNITPYNMPVHIPYIYAGADDIEAWKKRFSAIKGCKVGIVWSGNAMHENDHNRSCELSCFSQLASIANIQLISLQVGNETSDIISKCNFNIHDFTENLSDWSQTAAAIANLDLVISVDTSVAHLAGAMGQPVWVLLPYAPDWRWMLERNDSPWYPGMRLYRQTQAGDWSTVFSNIYSVFSENEKEFSGQNEHNIPIQRNISVAGMKDLGLSYHKNGQLDIAKLYYKEILKSEPDNKEVLMLLANLLLQNSEVQSSALITDLLRSQDKQNPYVFNLSGLVHMELGSFGTAEIFFKEAIRLLPGQYYFHDSLATVYKGLNKLVEAVEEYTICAELQPANEMAYYHRALVYELLEEWTNATDDYLKAISCKSDFIEAYTNLGGLFYQTNDYQESVNYYLKALEYAPENPELLHNAGLSYQSINELDNARDCYKKALKYKPDYADVYLNLGAVEQLDGNIETAINCYSNSIELAPDNPIAHNNRGAALQRLNRVEDAIKEFLMSIQLDPDYADGHFNLSLAYLLCGQYKQGWREYEWRLKREVSGVRPVTGERWDGCELNGKRILVYVEQGYGDTFQFIRFLPEVQARGGVVIFESQLGLGAILEQCQGINELIDWLDVGDKQLQYDISIPLMSLPYVLDINLDNIPVDIPYIKSNQKGISEWQQKMDPASLNAGIVWAGRPTHQNDRNRSCSLGDFVSLFDIENVRFYSLQKGDAVDQLEKSDFDIVNLDSEISSFSDTASIISALDLVITVDTSVAHLAGAMGKQVWVILPYAPDWRWLLERDDSPWYPQMRLFRQQQAGDWQSVFMKIRNALADLTAARLTGDEL